MLSKVGCKGKVRVNQDAGHDEWISETETVLRQGITECATGQGTGCLRVWCQPPSGPVGRAEEFGLFPEDTRNKLRVFIRGW